MRKITVGAPPSAGAVNVSLLTAHSGEGVGEVQTLFPSSGSWTFEVPSEEEFTLLWRPIGGRTTVHPIPAGDEDVVFNGPSHGLGEIVAEVSGEPDNELLKQSLRSIRRVGALNEGNFELPAISLPLKAKDVWTRLQPSVAKFVKASIALPPAPPSLSASTEEGVTSLVFEPPTGKFAVGVASDATPRRYGGWRPYFGRWPIRVGVAYGRLTLEFPRQKGELLDPDGLDGSRVRVSLAVEGKQLRRFLAPLYAGGAQVVLKSSGVSGDDLAFEINPVDPELRVLVQSLAVSNAEDAKAIEGEVTTLAQRAISVVRDQKVFDPWMALVVGLIIKRHRWAEPCDWALTLAERFPWISDTLVLAAWWCSRREETLPKSLEFLSRARKRGSLYFAESNSTLRDLLVWLSADAPDRALKEQAHQELALWRTKVPFQTWGGANFAWVVEKSQPNGRLPDGSDLVIRRGSLSEFVGSLDPNKGRFGGQATSSGRRLKASVAPTDDSEWFAVSLEVAVEPSAPALAGAVKFHLHPTFAEPVRTVQANGNVARLNFKSWGAFTVGVVCDGGRTKLELDLAELPDVPKAYRSR